MALARGFAALSSDLFVKAGAIAIAHRVAALFSGFAHGHVATGLLLVAFGCRFCHWGSPGDALGALALKLLAAFLAYDLIERGAVLFFRGLSAFTADGLVELCTVFGLDALAATLACLANSHAPARILDLVLNRHAGTCPLRFESAQ